jgi:rRNA maturation endonuclease Nob1
MNAFKCPGCGNATWGNLKYCPICGQSLDIKCPDCGYSQRYMYAVNHSFCPDCGAKLNTKTKALAKKEKQDDK